MRGISLIEVLVGLMLFSFGILGLVGLQASMTEAQTDSKFRADAAYLADELVGIMWSQVGINASDLSGLASYTTAGCGSIPQCADWQAKLSSQLPQGTLSELTVDANVASATVGNVKITLQWTMPNGSAHKYTTIGNVAPPKL